MMPVAGNRAEYLLNSCCSTHFTSMSRKCVSPLASTKRLWMRIARSSRFAGVESKCRGRGDGCKPATTRADGHCLDKTDPLSWPSSLAEGDGHAHACCA